MCIGNPPNDESSFQRDRLASLSGDAPMRRCSRPGERYGLMAAPSADLAPVVEQVAAERAARRFSVSIARFFHCEDDDRCAVEHGGAVMRAYPRLMGVQFSPGKLPPMSAPDASAATIVANAVIGARRAARRGSGGRSRCSGRIGCC
ncbi:hypothetical protein [Burkholderia oklahomensis]|uniref:hypothetical protein n=1 Tax=Burkholderia oklahomensis TaxID=342113 RepID=UPI00016A9B98|nr:hypothetical protein [Burkholderia oklahomensis]AOI48912.1 luciferase [Burkholderia oklahomensis C6786]KUY50487.1 luciferase [Burkholderia oklahomensis C6786]MBI0362879.1 luciferase [Burkholderia oklahomensis]